MLKIEESRQQLFSNFGSRWVTLNSKSAVLDMMILGAFFGFLADISETVALR